MGGDRASRKQNRSEASASSGRSVDTAAAAADQPPGKSSRKRAAPAKSESDEDSSDGDWDESTLAATWHVGDFLAPPFMGHQLEKLQQQYSARGDTHAAKKITVIKSRHHPTKISYGPDGKRVLALRQWAEPAAASRGQSAKKRPKASAAAAGGRSPHGRVRPGAVAGACESQPAAGKCDLRCSKCKTAAGMSGESGMNFVYVAELMRFFCEECFQEATGIAAEQAYEDIEQHHGGSITGEGIGGVSDDISNTEAAGGGFSWEKFKNAG